MVALGALQNAIFGRLSSISCRIYDDIPCDAVYPYIRYDSEDITDNKTKTTDGSVHLVYLNIFSKYRGYREAKEIADEVLSELGNRLDLVGGYTADIITTPATRFVEDIKNDMRQGTLIVTVHISN